MLSFPGVYWHCALKQIGTLYYRVIVSVMRLCCVFHWKPHMKWSEHSSNSLVGIYLPPLKFLKWRKRSFETTYHFFFFIYFFFYFNNNTCTLIYKNAQTTNNNDKCKQYDMFCLTHKIIMQYVMSNNVINLKQFFDLHFLWFPITHALYCQVVWIWTNDWNMLKSFYTP